MHRREPNFPQIINDIFAVRNSDWGHLFVDTWDALIHSKGARTCYNQKINDQCEFGLAMVRLVQDHRHHSPAPTVMTDQTLEGHFLNHSQKETLVFKKEVFKEFQVSWRGACAVI